MCSIIYDFFCFPFAKTYKFPSFCSSIVDTLLEDRMSRDRHMAQFSTATRPFNPVELQCSVLLIYSHERQCCTDVEHGTVKVGFCKRFYKFTTLYGKTVCLVFFLPA